MKRIALLDILRGFAIIGTLGTNIWIFAYLGDLNLVFGNVLEPWWSSGDRLVQTIMLILVNGKFLGMLTLLFGAGMELKRQKLPAKATHGMVSISGHVHFCCWTDSYITSS